MRSVFLALVLVYCFGWAVSPACAESIVVPGDIDGDRIVSADEVAAAERLAKEGKLSGDELEEIRHIHQKYPITITDTANRTVTIHKPVEKIISQCTFTYEPLFILGAQDRLVAVTNTAQEVYFFLPGIKEKPTVGSYRDVDLEKVIENRPDVYIVGSNRTIADLEKKLGPAGTAILVMEWTDINKFDWEFGNLAKLLEKEDSIDEFLAWREGYLSQIRKGTEKIGPQVRVYNEYHDTPWATGSRTSGISDVITMAGGHNVADALEKLYYAEVSPEWVMQQDPEVILVSAFSSSLPSDLTRYDIETPEAAQLFIQEASNRTGLKETDAVKDGRVYVLDGETSFSSCRGIVGICYCAKWFYPEVFGDLDPEAVHKEYFERWLGAPYRGIWAYPQAS